MMRHALAALALSFSSAACTVAEDTRFFVENGVTYRETRRVAKVPVADVHFVEQTQTVYRTETITQLRDETRTYWVPVPRQVYEPRWQASWNPFAKSSPAYELRTVWHWEPRQETVRVPVTVQQAVPETKIVQVPVRSLGFIDQEYVERVAISNHPPAPPASLPPTPQQRRY